MLSQDYSRIEYIVVDGGSTDETLALLENYRGRLRFITGKDKGPSDAIHRGFSQAKGEILAWINADDTYLPGAVRAGVEFLEAHAEIDVVYGEGYWVDENGGRIDRYPTLPFDKRMLERDCFICQPASFFRASAYRRSGLDPDLGLSFDYDLWIRMAKQGFALRLDSAVPGQLANAWRRQDLARPGGSLPHFHGAASAPLRLCAVPVDLRLHGVSHGRPRPVLPAARAHRSQVSGQPADGAAHQSRPAPALSRRMDDRPAEEAQSATVDHIIHECE